MNFEDEDTRESQTQRKKSVNVSKSDLSHYKSIDEKNKLNRNKFLTNCLNKLQNAYASCKLRPVKLDVDPHDNTKTLEQQLINSNINLDDSDIVSCDANSILTPRGMDNIKEFKFSEMDNFLDLSNYAAEGEVINFDRIEIREEKDLIEAETKIGSLIQATKIKKEDEDNNKKKVNIVQNKSSKLQPSKKITSIIKKEIPSRSISKNKPSLNLKNLKMNELNLKPGTPRLSTPKYSPVNNKSINLNKNKSKEKYVPKLKSPTVKAQTAPLQKLNENEEILMELENIFGENLETFDENCKINYVTIKSVI